MSGLWSASGDCFGFVLGNCFLGFHYWFFVIGLFGNAVGLVGRYF